MKIERFDVGIGIKFYDNGAAVVDGPDYLVCPACNEPRCNASCAGAQGAYTEDNAETEADIQSRLSLNAAMDGLTSMLCSAANNGLMNDKNMDTWKQCVKSVVYAISNTFGN